MILRRLILLCVLVALPAWLLPVEVFGIVFWAFVAPTILRMCIQAVQRYNGTWNPESFHKWIWWPWRQWFLKPAIKFTEWRHNEVRAGKNPTSAWGGLIGRLVLVFKSGDVLLGGFGYYGLRLFQPLGFKAQRHLAMVAGTGSGKTTFLITMLGLHKGNAFVVDPKGQITKVIASRRGHGRGAVQGMGKHVAVLDPNGIVSGIPSASWNAIEELDRVADREGRDRVLRYASKMAEALVQKEKGEKPFFPKSARSIVRSLILYVFAHEPEGQRNMLRVRELLTRGFASELRDRGASDEEAAEKGLRAMLTYMQTLEDFNGAIAKGAATLADSGKSYGDVLSTARSALEFYDFSEIAGISGRSDFSLEDLKLGQTDVFVCAPTGDIRVTYQGWFRLLTMFSLDLFEQIPESIEQPTLFAIDEMPSLGRIENLATAAPVMRSYGVRLLAITQDITLIKSAYPDEWTSFLGSADATYWMGTNHQETLSYLSDYLGESKRTWRDNPWWKFWRLGSKTSDTQALLTPRQAGEILNPEKENMIVTRFGKKPLRVKTMPYYKELPIAFYEPDSDHKETPERSATRQRLAQDHQSQSPQKEPVREALKPKPAPERPKQKPKPSRTPQEVDFRGAMAMFGLHDVYTIDELQKRKVLLLSRDPSNHANRVMVESAYFQLEKALRETEAILN